MLVDEHEGTTDEPIDSCFWLVMRHVIPFYMSMTAVALCKVHVLPHDWTLTQKPAALPDVHVPDLSLAYGSSYYHMCQHC